MATKAEQAEAIASLRRTLHRGSTVHTVSRHTSPSGMTRWLDVYLLRNGQPVRLTWSVAKALGWTYDLKRDALKVEGCGMDMGFHTVHSLSYALHGHENHNAEGSKRSGYTLTQRWL